MQSTPPPGPSATPAAGAAPPLLAAFAAVPDPRRAASVVYALPAVLALAAAALLANHPSVLAIAEWGARQEPALLAALGFPGGRPPCQSTLPRLFRRLDGDALAVALATGLAALPGPPEAGLRGVAVDGKAPRGRLQDEAGRCPVHALSAFCHETGVVLAHEPIGAGADQAEAELTVAPALLARIDWRGRVLTGDALFCQRGLCRQVVAAGGDDLLLVTANQPRLHEDIRLLFAPPPGVALPLLDRREARTWESGHGRRDEARQLVASTDLGGHLDWPGATQVFRLERTWRERGVTKRAVRYGVTSLGSDRADAACLLRLRRAHWGIEHRRHRRKDVTFGEDASLIHPGQGPTVMALLRDAAVSLLHRAGVQRVAARLRAHAQHPDRAIALVVGPLPTHA